MLQRFPTRSSKLAKTGIHTQRIQSIIITHPSKRPRNSAQPSPAISRSSATIDSPPTRTEFHNNPDKYRTSLIWSLQQPKLPLKFYNRYPHNALLAQAQASLLHHKRPITGSCETSNFLHTNKRSTVPRVRDTLPFYVPSHRNRVECPPSPLRSEVATRQKHNSHES